MPTTDAPEEDLLFPEARASASRNLPEICLRAAKERGINTALESMACAPFEVIEEILPYLDLYLMDIKHTNPAKHKEFTGRANDLMMENARKVALVRQVQTDHQSSCDPYLQCIR